jgi:hypothetical protein
MNAVGKATRTKVATGTGKGSVRTGVKAAIGSQAAGAIKTGAGAVLDAAKEKFCSSTGWCK